jgi:hypothetical protein
VTGYDLSRPDPGKTRGVFGGPCVTEDCLGAAMWIPTAAIPTQPQPFLYRCTACAERFDEAAWQGRA